MWVKSKALIWIFRENVGSICEFWVNPVNFTFDVGVQPQPNLKPDFFFLARPPVPCAHAPIRENGIYFVVYGAPA